MRPKHKEYPLEEYLQPTLVNIIDENHPLCKLTKLIDWKKLEEIFGKTYSPNGRPGISIRLMIGLNYLKYLYNLSDEDVVFRWSENPYWQYFTGEKVFQTNIPIDPSSMTRFRKRLKKKKLLALLEETVSTGFKSGYLKKSDVKRVNVDTTVQEKNIAYPTDIKLYFKLICYLNKYAKKKGIKVKQSYLRKSKKLLLSHRGYVHDNKFKKASKRADKLKTFMGRLYRDIERKLVKSDKLDSEFEELTNYYYKLLTRERKSKDKLYSLHEPSVECIGKGKFRKPYEFGNKVGVVSTSNKGFILSCVSFQGNPHDSKTLKANLELAKELLGDKGKIEKSYVDLGYRGHNYDGDIEVNVVPRNIKNFKPSVRKWLKKRSGVEAVISMLKRKNRLNRNYLKGVAGNEVNAILSSCGYNLRMLLAFLYFLFNFLRNNLLYLIKNHKSSSYNGLIGLV